MIIHTVWYGTFVLDGSREVEFSGAEKDPKSIAEDMSSISGGEVMERERTLVEKYPVDAVTEERLKAICPEASIVEAGTLEIPSHCEKGYEIALLVDASSKRAETISAETGDDRDILSAVGALDDIENSLNLLTERTREWYAKYWSGASENIVGDKPLEWLAEDSSSAGFGNKLKEARMDPGPFPQTPVPHNPGVSELARRASDLISSRVRLESYIEERMVSVAPNLSEVVGPLIGARLIHSAGGLKRLCMLPASTVQVLGAEKAFFKFLKDGGKPPKHGVLFQHPMVHSMDRRKRGKAARALASSGSLASRLDYYGGYDAERLKKRVEGRLGEIRDEDTVSRDGRSGRQPPFREGWWAKKGRKKRRKGRRR